MKTRTWTDWSKEKLSSIKESVQSIYHRATDTIATASHAVKKVLSYDYVSKFFLQYWEGLIQPLDLHHLTRLIRSPKSRAVYYEAVKVNVIYYLGVILLVESFNTAFQNTSFGKNQKPLNYSTVFLIDKLLTVLYGIISAHRTVDNAQLNLALVKDMVDENPISRDIVPPCTHGEAAIVKAAVLSPVYSKTLKFKIWMLSHVPFVKYFAPIGYAYADGTATAEILYGAAGNCTEDRATLLAQNLGFSMGIGTSIELTQLFWEYLLWYETGVQGYFVSDAINSMISPFFVTSVLLRDRKLESFEKGIDLSYFHRHAISHKLEVAGTKILPLLQSNDKPIDWVAEINRVQNFPPTRFCLKAFSYDLYGNWSTPEGFIVGMPSKLLMEAYFNLLLSQIEKFAELHKIRLTKKNVTEFSKALLGPVVASLPDKVTAFFGLPDSSKQILNMFFTAHTEEILKMIKEILLFIYQKQQQSTIKIIPHHLQDIETKKEIKALKEPPPKLELDSQNDTQAIVLRNSKVGLFNKPNQTSSKVDTIYEFLIDLRDEVEDKKWNDKGKGFFKNHVPETIDLLRAYLKPLLGNMSPQEIKKIFEQVSTIEVFKQIYQFIPKDFNVNVNVIMEQHKDRKRDKEVEQFYIDKAVQIRKLCQGLGYVQKHHHVNSI